MIAVIIPAYNEEKTVAGIVRQAKKYADKVVVVDDASKDKTANNARLAGAEVIRHARNAGLGSAIRTGLKYALRAKADIAITLDADGQHDPEDIPKFLKKISEGYDFVLGERSLHAYPFRKKLGNFLLTHATNFVSGTELRDTESGFRAFSRKALQSIQLKAERYEIAVEIIFEVGRNNLRACNVKINSPVYVQGVNALDGLKNFMFLLHRRERNWRSYIDDAKYVIRRKLGL